MKPSTAVGSLADFGHVGCHFSDRAEFYACAEEFIADGLAENQWVEFVGASSREQLRAELRALPAVGDRLNIRGLGVSPASEFYELVAGIDVVDPSAAINACAAAVEKAIDAGYNGFRLVTDATPLARRPGQRVALSRFEFLLGRNMAGLPFSALCAYDRSQIAGGADELLCLHPHVDSDGPSFGLYPQSEVAFALTGELDAANDELYLTTLRRIWSLIDDDPVIIDTTGLEFVTHQQLYTLDHYARTDGREIILRTNRGILTRLARVLDLTNVTVEPSLPIQAPTLSTNSILQALPT